MVIYIYTLADPVTREVRYVGRTVNPPRRYSNHLSASLHTHKGNWIKGLRTKGLTPMIEILDECNELNWVATECYWIEQLRQWGFNLTNHLAGGGGIPRQKSNYIPWNKGKVTPEPTRKKISAALKLKDYSYRIGRKPTQEAIDKRVAKISGVNHCNSKFKLEDLEDIRQLFKNNVSNKSIATLYSVRVETISRLKNNHTYKQ